MADQWELILHHSYVGTPGVIVDRSPRRRSHGRAIDISDESFLLDGATEGSGAVDFSGGGRIHVPITADAWDPLLGLRIDVVCIRDQDATGGSLVAADTFGIGVSPDGNMRAHFDNDPDPGAGQTGGGTGGSGGLPVLQTGIWSTISFIYDGFFNCYWTLNGELLPWITDPLTPLVPPRQITIGAHPDGGTRWPGRIDDVKVWRINPYAVDDDFGNRPMDPAVRECWAQWHRRLDEVLRSDPECAERAVGLLNAAFTSLMRDLFTTGAYNRPELREAALRYQQLWREGRLAEIPAVLADLLAWLRTMGFDSRTNTAAAAALDDDCVRRIGERLTVDCDSQLTNMLDGVLLP